jgi:hypothetical protein
LLAQQQAAASYFIRIESLTGLEHGGEGLS